jgi:hypothetical protein
LQTVDWHASGVADVCATPPNFAAVRINCYPLHPLIRLGLGENLHLIIKVTLSTLNLNECTE